MHEVKVLIIGDLKFYSVYCTGTSAQDLVLGVPATVDFGGWDLLAILILNATLDG